MDATKFELYEDHDGLYRMRSRVDGHLVAKDLTAEDALALFVLGKERAELLGALKKAENVIRYPNFDHEYAKKTLDEIAALIAKLSQE